MNEEARGAPLPILKRTDREIFPRATINFDSPLPEPK
jgi:hypothetical protein